MGGGAHVGTRSVLFTDLVDSTQLRVRLGDDGADALRRLHDVLIADAVLAHGGTVVKGLGDGVLATFESAATAVAGAVAVQQAAESHGRRVPEQALAIRVGISIGDVSTEGGDVFGVPVVEAARLCAMARAGEILAADVVRALARGRENFVFEPMGSLSLKGLPEPVDACRVIWEPLLETAVEAGSQVPITPALLGATTPYVGRERLREQLDAGWSAVRAGSCRTTLLAGEPGVGKTRTAAELARSAYTDGALVLYGRCDEDLDVPYQPFVEALEYYGRSCDRPVLGRLAGELVRLVPDLATSIPSLPPPVLSDPASEEYRLYEAVTSWLLDAARTDCAGLVLVLDDIHWATKPTLRLLEHVVRGATDENAPVWILATYRDTDIDRTHPLSAALGDLRRLPGVDRLPVSNLSNDEVLTFIETAAGHELDAPTRHLAATIYDETEGNPFFIGEVLRHLIETGGVQRSGDRWVVADPDTLTVPEGVRDVVGRRLSRLTGTANTVLSVAAVIGRDFNLETLFAVVDLPEDEILDAIDVAARARLVTETGVDQYRFAHALVRTTLYDELSATRRRRLHRRVADVLEKTRPDDVRALAHHTTQAGGEGADLARAVRYTLAAAEQSLAARAFADAEAGFRTALDLLADGVAAAPHDSVAALCGLGEAQRDQGDAGFRETLLVASEHAIELGDVALLTRAVLANSRGFASIIGGVDWQRLTYIEKAVELTGTAPSADRARLLGQLASELTFSGEHERRLVLADEAERIARSLDDPVLVGEVIVATGYARSAGADWEHLLVRSAEGARLADLGGDPARRVIARVFSSGALLAAGQIEASGREIRDAIDLAEAEGAPLMRWTAGSNAIRLSALAGELDEAEAQNATSLELANRLGQPDGAQWWAATVVGIMWLRGRADDFADATGVFAEQYPLARVWRTAQAWILAEAGRVEEAREVVDAYGLGSGDLLVEPWPFVPVFQVALATWYIGDAELAAELADVLAPYRTCWSHYYLLVMGPLTWPLGLMRAITGAYDEAIADLQEALSAVTSRGFPAYAARIGLHLGEVLVRRSATGDRERAAAVLARARADAVAVGATGVVARIDTVRP